MRTAAVLMLGVLVSIIGSAVLDHLMEPRDFIPTLHEALSRNNHSPVPTDTMRRLQRAGKITTFVADPIVGLVVGMLVGLLQKKYAAIVSSLCMAPQFLLYLASDSVKNWAKSPSGVAHYLGDSSLPFIAAIIGAVLARYLVIQLSSPSEVEAQKTA